MKYLKLFERHITEAEVTEICKKYDIDNWTLNSNDINTNGFIDLSRRGLTKLPLKFGRSQGGFDCGYNKLSSLENAPKYISGAFSIRNNRLDTLKGCPQYIGGDFSCEHNNIKSFEGIGYIGGGFYCTSNPIFTLWRLFYDVSKIDQFNEWEIIQGDNVYLYRLNDFLETIGKEEVTNEQLERIKNYYKIV